jgi:uncharacterized protein DUF4375
MASGNGKQWLRDSGMLWILLCLGILMLAVLSYQIIVLPFSYLRIGLVLLGIASICFCLKAISESRTDKAFQDRVSKKDRRLCDRILAGITTRYHGDDLDVSELPEEHRVVLLVTSAQGIISNGGFNYLFEGSFKGDPHYLLTAGAFEAIGCQKAANAFQEALALFPDGKPPIDMEERLQIYRRGKGEQRHKLDCAIWDSTVEIETKLANYIRSHREAYRELPLPKRKKAKPKRQQARQREEPLWTAQVPHWARVAFAARCARAALPFFTANWPNAQKKRRQALEKAIALAEQSAAAGQPADGLKDAKMNATITAGAALIGIYGFEFPQDKEENDAPDDGNAAAIASAVAKAAEYAAEAARSSPNESAAAAISAWISACDAANKGPEFRGALQDYFDMLFQLASEGHWTDDTPVPPEVLK